MFQIFLLWRNPQNVFNVPGGLRQFASAPAHSRIPKITIITQEGCLKEQKAGVKGMLPLGCFPLREERRPHSKFSENMNEMAEKSGFLQSR
jgi:hypothetical protein